MTDPIRILIVDDHTVVREGLQTLLAEEPGIEIAGQGANGLEAVELARAARPDVVLMDLVMPQMDGIEATRRVLEASPASRVLVLTSFAGDEQVREAIRAGAIGYLLKDVLKPELLAAIRAAAAGKPALHPEAQRVLMRQATTPQETPRHASLTGREGDVLALIGQGMSNKEIAAALNLTEGTVKGYVSAILDKLDVADRTQAALYAARHGLAADSE